MEYLKLTNCKIKGLFPEIDGYIDWLSIGFDPVQLPRLSVQGFTDEDQLNHVSLLPITNKDALIASGIIETANSNGTQENHAEIVGEAEFIELKSAIENVKNLQ